MVIYDVQLFFFFFFTRICDYNYELFEFPALENMGLRGNAIKQNRCASVKGEMQLCIDAHRNCAQKFNPDFSHSF